MHRDETERRREEPPPSHLRARLADIAKLAGVSASTVSRATRDPQLVSQELRDRVERAVRDLSYVPSRAASALASGRSRTIGVVVPSITDGVFGEYLAAMEAVLKPAGFRLHVLNSNREPTEEEAAIVTLLGERPEAMIVAGVDQTERARLLLKASGVPVVQTMELAERPLDINIGVSQQRAGYTATKYLLNLGHRRIGYIGSDRDPAAHRLRAGYCAAMKEAGIDRSHLIATAPLESSVALGGELISHLLAKAAVLDAVFCSNDDLALGSLFGCIRRGIAVPGELSLMGFNDLAFCASTYPSLTSVATPRSEMGRQAAEIAIEIIGGLGRRPTQRRVDLGFSLSERQSVRRRVASAIGESGG